jgi:hypothetical protein
VRGITQQMYFRDDDMIDDVYVHEEEKRLYLYSLCQPPNLAVMGHSILEGYILGISHRITSSYIAYN